MTDKQQLIEKMSKLIEKLKEQASLVNDYHELISKKTILKTHFKTGLRVLTNHDIQNLDERFTDLATRYLKNIDLIYKVQEKVLPEKVDINELYNNNFIKFLERNFDTTIDHPLLTSDDEKTFFYNLSSDYNISSISNDPNAYKRITDDIGVQGQGAGGPIHQSESDFIIYNFVQIGFGLFSKEKALEKFISELNLMHSFSRIKSNAVIIGANGSGKSTLANSLMANDRIDNIEIIKSHHMLYLPNRPFNFDQSSYLDLEYSYYNRRELFFDEDSFINDFHTIFDLLIKQHTMQKGDTHSQNDRKSILEEIVNDVNNLLGKELLVISGGSIKGYSEINDTYYEFNELSDGERKIIYLIARIKISDRDSYIIIDEPENHLNPNILYELCDFLEFLNPTSTFIYITHDPNFASSRKDSTLIWSRKFIAPDDWDFEIIDNKEREGIRDDLLIEILGSKKKIMFCEGNNNSSLDYKIYSAVFPEYKIFPVKGHGNVVAYTKAMSQLSLDHHFVVSGIIDSDNLSSEQVDNYKKDNIHVLPYNEIEMLMISPEVIEHFFEFLVKLGSNNDHRQKNIDDYKDSLIEFIDDRKDRIIASLVASEIDSINERYKIGSVSSKKKINEIINKNREKMNIDKLWEYHENNLNCALKNKDINKILRICNIKKEITRTFINEYFGKIDYENYFINSLDDKRLTDILKTKICL